MPRDTRRSFDENLQHCASSGSDGGGPEYFQVVAPPTFKKSAEGARGGKSREAILLSGIPTRDNKEVSQTEI